MPRRPRTFEPRLRGLPALAPALLAATALLLLGCGRAKAHRPFDLRRSLQGAAHEVVVADGALADRVRAAGLGAVVEPGAAPVSSPDGERGRARTIVGLFDDPHVARWLDRMQLEREPDALTLAGVRFANPGDVLAASFADPERPGLPLNLLCARDPDLVAGYLDGLRPAWRPSLCLFSRGLPVARARLTMDGRLIEESLRIDRSALVEFQRRYAIRAEQPFEVFAPAELGDAEIDEYVTRLRRANGRLLRWVGDDLALPRVTVVLHGHAEDLKRFGPGDRWPAFDPRTGVAHALVHELLPDDGGAAALLARARLMRGPAASSRVERSAAIEAADRFWGRPLERWVGELCAAGLGPGESFPVSEAKLAASPLRWVALEALLWRHVVEEEGAEAARERWAGTRPFNCEGALRSSFDARLAALAAEAPERLDPARPGRFMVGANLLTSDRPRTGLGSRAAERSLESLRAIQANTVAIAARDVWELGDAEWAGGVSSTAEGMAESGDGDLELAATIAYARRRGFLTILRPELWVAPSGNLAGRLSWGDEGPWMEFFERYVDFVEHYGLLATLCGVDGLFIGADLPEAFGTEGRDEEVLAWKRASWPRVTRRARQAFSGWLAYGALWPNQVRKIELWSDVDLCGVELFNGVRDPERPGMRPGDRDVLDRMRVALLDACNVGEEVGRPTLISAVGFPARERAWDSVSLGGGAVDPREQERLLAQLARALLEVRERRPGLAGVLLWSWSTDPDAGGPDDGGFTPQHKPAEAVLRGLFGALR